MNNKPKVEANDISKILRLTVPVEDRFPVDVRAVALEISKSKFSDPITDIKACDLPGFEGMLARNRAGTKWMIAYNDKLSSDGRILFTLAHEFGHYLMHRRLREEFMCTHEDMHTWDSMERVIEAEADIFASYLLMPLDDFRHQVEGQIISIDLLRHCGNRYGVSLTAAALKWREIAPGRVLVVAAKDGYLDWSCSNEAAFRSGAYFATTKETIEVPKDSILNSAIWCPTGQVGKLKANVWFPCESAEAYLEEHAFVIKGQDYNYTLGILLLPDVERSFVDGEEELLTPLDGQMVFR